MDNSEQPKPLDPQLQKLFDEMKDGLDKCIDESLVAFNKVREAKEKELRRQLKKK